MQELFEEYECGVDKIQERLGELRKEARTAKGAGYLQIQHQIMVLCSMRHDMNYALDLMARYLGRKRKSRRGQHLNKRMAHMEKDDADHWLEKRRVG